MIQNAIDEEIEINLTKKRTKYKIILQPYHVLVKINYVPNLHLEKQVY